MVEDEVKKTREVEDEVKKICMSVEDEITKGQEEKDVINEFKVVKCKDQEDKEYVEAENGLSLPV
jgi:hypothetical protein